MTNFEKYKKDLSKSTWVLMMTMNCRFCPYQNGCRALTRNDCMAKLTDWCDREAVEDKINLGGMGE